MNPRYIKHAFAHASDKSMSFPLFRGILPISGAQVPVEIVAGLTYAAAAMPEVLGYTKIAGMPVVTGLYTIIVPLALFACFGSSRHLAVGADSATAAVLAAGLVGIATVETPQYVAYAGLLALMAGAFLILARIVRLGFLADFLSRTVLVGFLIGVGLQVAVSQIPDILGLPSRAGEGPISKLLSIIPQLSHANPYTLAVAVAVIAIIVISRRISKRVPGALIAVVGAIIASYDLNLAAKNVSMVGAVPSGLPHLMVPQVTLSLSVFEQLLPIGFSMFIIIIAQSSATARAYASRYEEQLDENRDLIGLALANIGAAVSGTFVVNGSPTKTQMVDSAGGRSQLAQLATVVVVVVVLIFLTGPLAYMPSAVLAAIVLLVGKDLMDVKGMRRIFIQRRSEFWVALITSGTVFFVGVEQGIILAMVLSLLDHVRRGYKPKNSLLSLNESGERSVAPVSSHAQLLPGLIVYRFSHSMYYANAELFSSEVQELVNAASPPLIWFCLDLDAVDDIDFSAAETVRAVHDMLKQRKIQLVLAQVTDNIGLELDRYGITDLIGIEYIFRTVSGVETAFKWTIKKREQPHEGS